MDRPRLLFLSQALPYPPDSGPAIRAYHTLRILSRRYDVRCLCFFRRRTHGASGLADAAADVLGRLAAVEAFPIPQERSRVRFAADHLRSMVGRRAYTRYVYESGAFRSRLEELLNAARYEIIHVESLDLCAYLPALPGRRVVCVHHNVESRLLRQRARAGPGALVRRYLAWQADLVEREERQWLGSVALNVAVSAEDGEALRRLAPGAAVAVLPNGVDTDEFRPAGGRDDSIVFIGGTEWFPNVDALDHFCEEILPRLRASGPVPTVRWVGRAPPEHRRRYRERYGVELTGYVEDIRPLVRDAACTIVPLRIGGGTRLKITTAWAMAKAVVSTSRGCEGLAAVDGENIFVRDTPEGFAGAVRRLLCDPALRRRLGAAGRRTAEDRYSWHVIGEAMLRRYEALSG